MLDAEQLGDPRLHARSEHHEFEERAVGHRRRNQAAPFQRQVINAGFFQMRAALAESATSIFMPT
jgi:hypothetical protein